MRSSPMVWLQLLVVAATVSSPRLAVSQDVPDRLGLDRLGLDRAYDEESQRAPTGVESRSLDAPVPVTVLMKIGDSPLGSPVSALYYPSVGDGGQVAFTCRQDTTPEADECVWVDGSVVWTTWIAGIPATGIEYWSGTNGDGSEFIASVILAPDSLDSVITSAGVLLAAGDPAPGVPGSYITYASRSLMTAGGVAYWVSGYADTPGGATLQRALFRAPDTETPVIERVIGSGDAIDGFTVDSSFSFSYYVSDDDQHLIQVIDTTEDSSRDMFVAVDGVLVLREGDLIGGAESWDNFDTVQVCNTGRWIVSGDTDGDTSSDEFLAIDGVIVAREGDTLAGVPLGSTVRLASINDGEQIAFVWTTDLGTEDEALFVATNHTDLSNACLLARTGNGVDLNGDGFADGTILDLDTTMGGAQTLQFQEDGWVYLRSLLQLPTTTVDAVVGIRCPCILLDGFEGGSTDAWSLVTP